jgi:putative ATPase
VATDEADARGESYAAGSVAWVSDLFAAASGDVPPTDATMRPLAVRMRPRTIEEVRGQGDVLRQGSPLRRLIEGSGGAAGPLSAILWGPPGTGKTTLANLVATAADREFVELSAVTAGVKDVRAVMDAANRARDLYGRQTVLFLDEIHRFTKAQQDALLPGVENRQVILVAATTENPSFSVIAPLLSRSMLITLTSLTDEEVADVLDSAAADERGLAAEFVLADEARDHLVRMSGGDARRALTALEAAAGVAQDGIPLGAEPERPVTITLADTEQAIAHAAVRYDRAGDQHYDVASALIKSMRGSDVDAALHYLARMLEAGEDPRFIARRIVIAASEDVGMGDPTALQTAVAAMHAVAQIGMPEAGSSSPRPWSTTRWRPSRTPPMWASTRPSPTSAPGRSARSRSTCEGAGMPVPSGSRRPRPRRPARGGPSRTSTPTTSRMELRLSSTCPTTCRRRCRSTATTARPTVASRRGCRSVGPGCAHGSHGNRRDQAP